ncbi:SDR family oxidoreductase [Acinetobacter sp. C32I]|uniref:SDR family NAD(P)-dependent oxidoreductase n=1 Tax=Acinetobacter sp. C32I TaxID=2950074 RepID=UPI002036DAEF|nr:SDR family oxidoreductase [Acinetobacter sp. C32I]USA52271.1 SDR family oxidoreductase [Acinetobacter sp. C32I]
MDFKDKFGIVTGAGSGIGRATAVQLCKQGAQVLLVDYNRDAILETQQLIEDQQGSAYCKQANVANYAEVQAYVDHANELFPRIDFFHNNAGVLQKPSLLHETEQIEVERVLNVNLKGAYWGMQAVLKQMMKQKSGTIVNTSSHAGIRAESYLAIYAASKHALSGLTVSAAHEYGPYGIRVNAVCPGGVDTNMISGMVNEGDMSRMGPLRRLALAEEIANSVVYLLSENASYINGVLLPVDGGLAS